MPSLCLSFYSFHYFFYLRYGDYGFLGLPAVTLMNEGWWQCLLSGEWTDPGLDLLWPVDRRSCHAFVLRHCFSLPVVTLLTRAIPHRDDERRSCLLDVEASLVTWFWRVSLEEWIMGERTNISSYYYFLLLFPWTSLVLRCWKSLGKGFSFLPPLIKTFSSFHHEQKTNSPCSLFPLWLFSCFDIWTQFLFIFIFFFSFRFLSLFVIVIIILLLSFFVVCWVKKKNVSGCSIRDHPTYNCCWIVYNYCQGN